MRPLLYTVWGLALVGCSFKSPGAADMPGGTGTDGSIGNVLDGSGSDIDAAIDAYRAALDLDEGFVMVRVQLAKLLEERGDNVGAEQELSAALDALPTYADGALALAALRGRLGRHAESLDLLIDVLHRDAYNFEALIALGDTLEAMGRSGDALHASHAADAALT